MGCNSTDGISPAAARLLPFLVASALTVSLPVQGCAHGENGGGGTVDKPAMTLRRGGGWSTLSVALPDIIGPTFNLQLEGGELRGQVDSGSVHVKIQNNRADGFAPNGPVQLTIARAVDGALNVRGLWNGSPSHLTIRPDGVQGSVIQRPARYGKGERSCAYDLNNVDRQGAIVGSSTCSGMPLETSLEIDPRLRTKLRPEEQAVLLVALLSAPPFMGP
jgi:hypothetical protein